MSDLSETFAAYKEDKRNKLKQEVECRRKRFAEQSAKENRGVMTDDPCRKGSRGMYT